MCQIHQTGIKTHHLRTHHPYTSFIKSNVWIVLAFHSLPPASQYAASSYGGQQAPQAGDSLRRSGGTFGVYSLCTKYTAGSWHASSRWIRNGTEKVTDRKDKNKSRTMAAGCGGRVTTTTTTTVLAVRLRVGDRFGRSFMPASESNIGIKGLPAPVTPLMTITCDIPQVSIQYSVGAASQKPASQPWTFAGARCRRVVRGHTRLYFA
ncbi:hypothetical protein GGR56DRAFT_312855 [Xylariaceae sp. FL0804]|nr:hypothetical protein GGR56DRAFT_312855 [Xylariaceae sp. FL0804]